MEQCEEDPGSAKPIEVAIPPGKLDAFKRLGLKTAVVSDNMGAEIAQEGSFGLYQGH